MKTLKYKVPQGLATDRLDLVLVALAGERENLSRRRIRQVIDVGGCFVNGQRVRIASRALRPGDQVELRFSTESLSKVAAKSHALSPSDLLWRGADAIAINKPPGLPSQATRDQSVRHAEVAAMELMRSVGEKRRPMLAHRLDKETSGVLLLGLTSDATNQLMAQFKEKSVRKVYHAIVRGIPDESSFTAKGYLSSIDPKSGRVFVVRSGGKASSTDFLVLAQNRSLGMALIQCEPKTGRTHQIRVHLEHLGWPILGDKIYGEGIPKVPSRAEGHMEIETFAAAHHMLHAASIEFQDPSTLQARAIKAPHPRAFMGILAVAFPKYELD